MSAKLEKLTPTLWKRGPNYLHWCKGCDCGHVYPVPRWTFNDNPASPSFTPSMRILIPAQGAGLKHEPERTVCHYFVTDGRILYQPDCEHDLRGQTLPLTVIPEDYGF